MELFFKTWSSWRDYKGRAKRKEYWNFVITNTIFLALATWNATYVAYDNFNLGVTILTLASIYFIILLPPFIALSVRRMHDIGYSGWWVLLLLLPLFGWIWFFILTIRASEPIDNEYGTIN